jgi:hypothetical protein
MTFRPVATSETDNCPSKATAAILEDHDHGKGKEQDRCAMKQQFRDDTGVAPQGVGAPVAGNRGCRGRQPHDALWPAPEDDEKDRQQDQSGHGVAQDHTDPRTVGERLQSQQKDKGQEQHQGFSLTSRFQAGAPMQAQERRRTARPDRTGALIQYRRFNSTSCRPRVA